MQIKVKRNVAQDENGYWWIVSKSGKRTRKISYHAIIKHTDGLWHVKKRNGSLSKQAWNSLQEAFDCTDSIDRLIAFGIFIGIVIIIAIIVNLVKA